MRNCQTQSYFGLVIFFLLGCGVQNVLCQNFEFHLSNAMLITSIRLFDQISDTFYVFKSKNGSIILKADPGYGIMAVVQEMNLQTIQDPNGCLDYIKMSQVEGSSNMPETCGNIESSPLDGVDISLLPPHPAFVDKSGFLELDYVITEKSRLSPFLEHNITNFNVSFTPFKECPEDAFPFGNARLRPCSILDSFSCISTDFFCDGVINCGFPHEFGLDEQNCDVKELPDIHVMNNDDNASLNEEANIEDQNNDSIPKTPYTPYITLDNEKEAARLKQRQLSFIIWKYSNSANTGLFATLTIFILILGLIKLKREKGNRVQPGTSTLDTEGLGNSSMDKSGTFLLGDSSSIYYDAGSDPAPTYEDCLLDYSSSRPVYVALSIDHECPPSYEEVRVHSWSTNSKTGGI